MEWIGTRSSPSQVKMRGAAGERRELHQLIQSGRGDTVAEESTERHQPIHSVGGSGEEVAAEKKRQRRWWPRVHVWEE